MSDEPAAARCWNRTQAAVRPRRQGVPAPSRQLNVRVRAESAARVSAGLQQPHRCMRKVPTDEHPRPETVARFATRPRPNLADAQRSLALLTNWRTGTLATASVVGCLLPFAIAWRVGYLIAMAAAIVFAAAIAAGCHLARQARLDRLAVQPDLAQLPDLAATRRRLQTARTRRALAAGLRRAADPIQPPRRFDCCPVLVDRVVGVRGEMLALADDLEQTLAPDPASVALVRELLTSGTSPLYNPNLPVEHLHTALSQARAGLTVQSIT